MINILWPTGKEVDIVDFSSCINDLELGELSSLMFQGKRASETISYLTNLVTGNQKVLKFRQDCIGEMIDKPEFVQIFEQTLIYIEEIKICTKGIHENAEGLTNHSGINGFKETFDKLEKLFGSKSNLIDENDLDNYYGQLFRASLFLYRLAQAYTQLISYMKRKLDEYHIESDAISGMKRWIDCVYEQDDVYSSELLLKEISEEWANIEAFSIDVLLDHSMNIVGVELLSVEPKSYSKEGALSLRNGEEWDGLAHLMEFPQGGSVTRFQECLITALGTSLRTKLVKLRDRVLRIPCREAKALIALGDQLPFYISAARFAMRLKACHAAVCCPMSAELCYQKAIGAYPVSVLLIQGKQTVSNDYNVYGDGSIHFITGANSSGKTTALITIGQLQWLYQLGWWLPCESAAMCPVDGFYTLFASGESEDVSDSRMGLEAQKLELILSKITENSLVLMNEPMTSTSAGEGIQICLRILTDFAKRGASCVIVTHYNEMYQMLMNQFREKRISKSVLSYVMEIAQTNSGIKYLYRLSPKDPGRSSYSSEIISNAGLKLEDMLYTLQASGLNVCPDAAVWAELHDNKENC